MFITYSSVNMSKYLGCSLAFCGLLLSGCTVHFGYPTVVLPQSFEATAERIEVKPPVSRYKPSFFNVNLGELQVQDTFFGDVSKRRLSDKPERRVTENNTLSNIFAKQTLDVERVTYDQYRFEETSDFGFSVRSPTVETIKSQCSRSVIGLDNLETERFTSIRYGEVDDNEGYVKHYGEWLETNISCNLQQADYLWTLTSTTRRDSPASINLQGGDKTYSVQVLQESFVDEPGRGGRVSNTPDAYSEGDYSVPGFGVFQDGKQIAAVSLLNGNNWIWLSPEVAENDKPMLVSALHTMILESWIN